MSARAMLSAALPAAVLAACAAPAADAPTAADAEAAPQDAFFAALTSHCGKAYAGALVSDDPLDAEMAGRDMIMHVRDCSPTQIAVPFHISNGDGSWDRSRTWLITRTDAGLRLKHDHRHEDGTSDAVTMYGGDTAEQGTPRAQSFPVDAESIALFNANDLAASVTNVWRVEVDPANVAEARFAYQLARANRLFRVEFDLTKPVDAPPAPWGWD